MSWATELVRLLRPDALWAFLPWLALAAWTWRHAAVIGHGRATPAASPWAGVVDPALLPHLLEAAASGESAPSKVARHRVELLLLAVLIVALAGPQVRWPGDAGRPAPPLRPDATRVLVVDLSPGFDRLAEPEREKARAGLRRFVRDLPRGETALAVTAGDAWLVVPPTEDTAALQVFIDELAPAVVPVPGDRPAAGIALATAVLAASGAGKRAIYWLQAPGASPPPVQPETPQLVLLPLTGDADAWLAAVRASAPVAHPVVSALNLGVPDDGPGWVDTVPVLALLALMIWLWGGRRGGIAGSAMASAAIAVTLAAALPASPAHAADVDAAFAAGAADYRAGRYAEAAAAFAALPGSDARSHHNRGNALARAGRLAEALAAFDESLRIRPDDADTRHNRDLVARLLQSPQNPPPPPPPSRSRPPPPQSAEAERAAAQWLQRPPSDVEGLLKRKLALEQARRAEAGR